jgi:hypothetical protein
MFSLHLRVESGTKYSGSRRATVSRNAGLGLNNLYRFYYGRGEVLEISCATNTKYKLHLRILYKDEINKCKGT